MTNPDASSSGAPGRGGDFFSSPPGESFFLGGAVGIDLSPPMVLSNCCSMSESISPFWTSLLWCFTTGSSIGQSLLDTKVLVRLNSLVARMSSLPSTSLEICATGWPEILTDHQSIHPVKPLADGFHDLPSIALMKLGSSFPPRNETRPSSLMNLYISSFVLSR